MIKLIDDRIPLVLGIVVILAFLFCVAVSIFFPEVLSDAVIDYVTIALLSFVVVVLVFVLCLFISELRKL